jgi:hypothetical protein
MSQPGNYHEDRFIEIANLKPGQSFRSRGGHVDKVVRIDASKGLVYCESTDVLSFDDGYVEILIEEIL